VPSYGVCLVTVCACLRCVPSYGVPGRSGKHTAAVACVTRSTTCLVQHVPISLPHAETHRSAKIDHAVLFVGAGWVLAYILYQTNLRVRVEQLVKVLETLKYIPKCVGQG
jgi:hypothetical protein